jgi:hypothetical protein
MKHYEGSQWIVTDDGIERRDGGYFIRAEDLDNDLGPGGWVAHMASKDWVDVADFKRAFDIAKRMGQR